MDLHLHMHRGNLLGHKGSRFKALGNKHSQMLAATTPFARSGRFSNVKPRFISKAFKKGLAGQAPGSIPSRADFWSEMGALLFSVPQRLLTHSSKLALDGADLAFGCLWLASNEGRDPYYSSPCLTHYSSLHVLFHSFIPI